MPDTTFTPINAAVRRINSDEGGMLRGFLGSDQSLDDFITDQGIDPAAAQQTLKDTGLTLPEKGLGNTFSSSDLKLYTDILQGDQDFFSASETFGFDAEAGVESLQSSGLRVPLQKQNREIFDTASSFGLSSSSLSNYFGVESNVVNSTLGAAGLSLPEFTPNAKVDAARTNISNAGSGSGGTSFLDSAFSGVPQAPGVKLGFLKNIGRKQSNPNIKSGPRGVTSNAPTRQNKLSAGSA